MSLLGLGKTLKLESKSEMDLDTEERQKKRNRGQGSTAAAAAVPVGGDASAHTDRNSRDLITLLSKSALKTQQELREAQSIMMDTLLLKDSLPLVRMITAATRRYSEMAKGQKTPLERAQLGAPHAHVWEAIIMTVKEAAQEKDDKVIGAELEKAVTALNAMSTKQEKLESIMKEVRFAKLSKTFKKDVRKLQVSVVPGTLSYNVWNLMMFFIRKHMEAEYKQGPAPRTALEREIQEHLDRLLL
eukprot:TRINITY_DN38114_c0_g1_i1.p2 TRINITY_DN38114_c0_g1~~TRINITY_DN38114_c0_g1_i1.p2  ORF type:complete len:244 (+),score=55.63 TRINITY_DN38114_c0_g1_i1:83-814(+)